MEEAKLRQMLKKRALDLQILNTILDSKTALEQR